MDSKISYQFKKHGYQLTGKAGDKSLYVDIGNDLTYGVIDHHQIRDEEGKKIRTATVMVFDPIYISHLPASDENIVVYTHTVPDCDAILSTYMAKVAIEDGVDRYEEIFAEGKYGYKLREYVNQIDTGFGKKVNTKAQAPTFYVAVCFLDRIACAWRYLKQNGSLEGFDYNLYFSELDSLGRTECDQMIIDVGHRLIESALEALEKSDCDLSTFSFEWTDFISDKCVRKYISSIYKEDYEKYLKERETSVNFEDIYVWGRNAEPYPRKVKAAIWREAPQSEFGYLYARAEDGAVITSIPWNIKEKNADNKAYTHVTISVDPENEVSRDISLKPLAEALELLEQIEENELFRTTGRWRRDHSSVRNGFEAAPFGTTSDPWFFTDDEWLVEDPGKHSLIEYGNIVSIIEKQTSLIAASRVKEYRDGKMCDSFVGDRMTISQWINKIKSIIAETKNCDAYNVITTEIDAVMIRFRNDVLKALCMSVLGNNVFENRNILEPDYYSCLLADEDYMLTFIANNGDKNRTSCFNGRRMECLRNGADSDGLKEINDKLSQMTSVVIGQRRELFEIGRGVNECVGNPVKSRAIYRKYVEFLAQEQNAGMISSLTEKEIYDYLQQMLKISDLKESIQDSVSIVTTDSKERVYSIFNFLSAVTIPFVIISTFFQMGMIHINPLVSDVGIDLSALWKWLIVLLLTIGLCIFFYRRGKK